MHTHVCVWDVCGVCVCVTRVVVRTSVPRCRYYRCLCVLCASLQTTKKKKAKASGDESKGRKALTEGLHCLICFDDVSGHCSEKGGTCTNLVSVSVIDSASTKREKYAHKRACTIYAYAYTHAHMHDTHT